jgi:hypothetical protein
MALKGAILVERVFFEVTSAGQFDLSLYDPYFT